MVSTKMAANRRQLGASAIPNLRVTAAIAVWRVTPPEHADASLRALRAAATGSGCNAVIAELPAREGDDCQECGLWKPSR
jgi:hypothetical protein